MKIRHLEEQNILIQKEIQKRNSMKGISTHTVRT